MAVSSTTATVCISGQKFPTSYPKNGLLFTNSVAFASKPRRFVIRSSSDESSGETAAGTATEVEEFEDTESPVEAPQGRPSLISALNVERALRGIPITDVDHYGRLGIPRKCPYGQVTVAYKNKVEELLNQGLDEEELSKKMELLKESYSILSSVKERRMYDWSLVRSEQPDKYMWPFEVDTVKPPREPPPPQEPEDERPTRLVGYFFLGWLILSVILSIGLNINR